MNRINQNRLVAIENLEARTLMTAVPLSITEVAYNGGTQLRVIGTAGNDQITVKHTAAGLVLGNTGGWTKTVTDPIKSLWINSSAGNNSIVIDPSVTINAIVFGGGINDTLMAGSGNDTLYGGTGKNVLQAGSGNDTLVSLGSISDTLIGGSGHDSFWTDNSTVEKISNLSASDAVHRVNGYINAPTVAGKKTAAHAKVGAAGTDDR